MTEIRRLHWGCGDVTPAGWINADITRGPGIDISIVELDNRENESFYVEAFE